MLIRKTRTAQWPLVAEFNFNVTDSAVNTSGAPVSLGANAGTVFDVMGLPPGATVIGGDVSVEVASNDSGAATISVGDSVSATRYLAATSTKTVARTPLLTPGYKGNGEDIRLTLSNAGGAATAGRVAVRVMYTVANRANEVQAP